MGACRGHQATAESLIEDEKQLLQQRIGEYGQSIGIQERQDHDKKSRESLHPVFHQGRKMKILRDRLLQRRQFRLEPL